jgi:hypothetical protein
MLKSVLEFITGAGKGQINSFLCTTFSAIGGILIAKGYLDAGLLASIIYHLFGIGFVALSFVGYKLNNEK